MTKKRCRHCHRLFIVSPRNPDQKFCSSNDCQKARKRKWQRKKMRDDPAYRLNQRDAQERWCQKNPAYWKTYRDEHPEYTRQNREKQRSRNHLLRTMAAISRQIAKMDAFSAKEHDISGYYGLISVQDLTFATMDAKVVKIIEMPDGYYQFGADCKERTR
jgi:hypothetical protein